MVGCVVGRAGGTGGAVLIVLAGIGTDKGPGPCLPPLNHIAICLKASNTVSTRVKTPAALPNWFRRSMPAGP